LHRASTWRPPSTGSWGRLMLQLQSLRSQYACFRSDIANFSCMLQNHPENNFDLATATRRYRQQHHQRDAESGAAVL
jgi:hypothetical protein